MRRATAVAFLGSLFLLCQAASAAFARGAAEDVAAGNAAYSRGDLPQAVSLFDRARREASGSSVALLDFGIALYAKGDYAAALTAFQDIRTPSEEIAAEVHYDQGNALARLGKQSEKDQPEAAMDFYRRSVAAYKRALAVDPRLSAAATNIEVVRGWMKSLSDSQAQPPGGGQQTPRQEQGNGTGQNAPGQNAPAPNAQSPNTQNGNPSQQTPQAPVNPPAASGQTTTPQNDTAESILQEERDRRQAEASAGGQTTNDSPNW